MVDTAGTLCTAAGLLKDAGARRVFAFASHGVLSGPATDRISKSALTELVVLDTVVTRRRLAIRIVIILVWFYFFITITMGCASRRLGRSPSSLWLHCWRKLSTIFTTESPFLLCSNRLLVRSHVRDEYGAYFRSISRLGSREVTYIFLKRTSSRIFQCKHNITSSQQFKSTAFFNCRILVWCSDLLFKVHRSTMLL